MFLNSRPHDTKHLQQDADRHGKIAQPDFIKSHGEQHSIYNPTITKALVMTKYNTGMTRTTNNKARRSRRTQIPLLRDQHNTKTNHPKNNVNISQEEVIH